MAVAYEGSRKKGIKLKTGFYNNALKINIPVIPIAFDFEIKKVNFGNTILLLGDIENNMLILEKHYKGVKGKIR